MCTVSFFYKGNNDFVLTSNRDESPKRETLSPAEYTVLESKMIFPKDVVGGGTWIGVSDQKRLICLLNGGFEKHIRLPNYRHSRGIVVKDLLGCSQIEEAVHAYNLAQIEPFTIIIVDWNATLVLYELVWDGVKKYFQKLPLHKAHIWSSSTLYSEEMKQLRRNWFEDFQQKELLQADSLLYFHTTAGIGNPNVDVIMDRKIVRTISVTQVEKKEEIVTMDYHDLLREKKSTISFNPIEELHE